MNDTHIIEIITSLFTHLGEQATVEKTQYNEQVVFEVGITQGQRYIGEQGTTLHALEMIVKKMAEKKGIFEKFSVDINGYKKEKLALIVAQAKLAAERAQSFETDVEMPPMNSFERLIVHQSVSTLPNIKTESRGEGAGRHIVIMYKKLEIVG